MPERFLDPPAVQEMLLAMADRIIAAEPILSEADRHLGDGDHGLGMARGFAAVKAKLATTESASIAKLYAMTGTALLGSMGGASGALFGTFFRDGGKALEGRARFDSAALADFLAAALAGVQARGGAKPGDKSMVDALEPAAAAACQGVASPLHEAATQVAAAAESGQEATRGLVARIGRAKTLGEACLGHPDPGAMSVALILAAVRDFTLGHGSLRS